MTATLTATRTAAMSAAADKFWGERLPFWDESEYMRGICETLADTFGVTDPENAKSEVWDEINAAHAAAALRHRAERIAAETLRAHFGIDRDGDDYPRADPSDMRAMLEAAALTALTDKGAHA